MPLAQSIDISCSTSGRGHLIFGDAVGGISLVDRDFGTRRFQAFKRRTTHVTQLRHADVLVSIGDGIDPRPVEQQLQSQRVAAQGRAQRAARRAAGNAESKGDGGESTTLVQRATPPFTRCVCRVCR